MTGRALRAAALAIAVVVAAAAPAGADGDRTAAERFFRAGERAYNAGQYLAAAEAFEEAYRLLPVPAIAFSTAQAYRLQYFLDKQPGHLKRAVELYRLYVDQQKTGGRVGDAATSLAELEPLMARMEAEGKMSAAAPPPKATRLMIVSQIDGARGTVDGAGGPLPLVVEVAPGEHAIAVEADGYFPVTLKASALDGELVPVEIDLKPRPALLDVTAEAGARVAIDGRSAGTVPLRGFELPAGKHFISVSRRGRRPFSREVVVARGDRVSLAPTLRATTQRRLSWWVLGGAGVLAVGAGLTGVAALSADGDAADLDEKRRSRGITLAELDRYDQLRRDRDDAVRATWILGGAAAATAAAGVLLVLIDTPETEPPPMSREPSAPPASSPLAVRPLIGPAAAGLVVHARF